MTASSSSFEARAKASSSSLLTGERAPGCLAGGRRVADELGYARAPACLGASAPVLPAEEAEGDPALPDEVGEAAEERDIIRGRLKPAAGLLASLATAGGLLRCALMLVPLNA